MLQQRMWNPLSSRTCHCLLSSARSYATAAANAAPAAASERPWTATFPPAPSPFSEQAAQASGEGGRRRRETGILLRTYKPRTPGVRHLKRPVNDHLWKGRPHLPLTFPKKGTSRGGRNNTGRITVRHRGGGHARRIRTVDFHRSAEGPQHVERIEYDPNRSAHIALLSGVDGVKSYIVAAEGMRAGDTVQSYMAGIPADLLASMGGVIDPGMLAAKTAFRGNCLPVHLIPTGTQIYNIGFMPKGKAVFCRSAGTYGVVVAKDEDRGRRYVTVRLQSGEVRKVHAEAPATVGVASNPAYHFGQLGKAGRKRWLGIRPTVRGVAMNAGL
ncbi:MAG: 50S ribosomal protein L2 [Terriglobus roseus]|nr:50S ribosomal protein L2 [Terriglobus roseus]